LDDGETIGDLDRSDLPATDIGLTGDGSDEVLRTDSVRPARPDEEARSRTPDAPTGARSAPCSAAVARLPPVRGGTRTSGRRPRLRLRDVHLFLSLPTRCLLSEADGRHRNLHRTELVGKRFDHDAVAVEV